MSWSVGSRRLIVVDATGEVELLAEYAFALYMGASLDAEASVAICNRAIVDARSAMYVTRFYATSAFAASRLDDCASTKFLTFTATSSAAVSSAKCPPSTIWTSVFGTSLR
jgi:hypothetical protein